MVQSRKVRNVIKQQRFWVNWQITPREKVSISTSTDLQIDKISHEESLDNVRGDFEIKTFVSCHVGASGITSLNLDVEICALIVNPLSGGRKKVMRKR